MNFGQPEMLWLLTLLAPLALFLAWAWRRKLTLIGMFVQSRLLANLTVGVWRTGQKIRWSLSWVAVLLVILALARPRWGFSLEEVRLRGLDVVVAIDTSKSMLAGDVAPSRLDRAKLEAIALADLARGDRLGLVAFAGTAFLQCPLTLDASAFQQSVKMLDTGIIPQGGSAVAEAIDVALTAFKTEGENHKVLILFTDGEDHDSGALETAKEAAKKEMRIFTVGVGTAEGELIRVRKPDGGFEYLKDEDGNVVKSKLDERLLQEIAAATKGFYLALRGAGTMKQLYERGLAPLPKSDNATRMLKQYHEQFQWPLGAAIVVLILELFFPERKRVKRPEIKAAEPRDEPVPTATEAKVPALPGASRGASLTALLCCLAAASTVIASPAKALKKYEVGNYRGALAEYEDLLKKHPKDARLQFNTGAAAYKAGHFEAAASHFTEALSAEDLSLQERAWYNLGNAAFRMGESIEDPDKKIKTWEEAVQHYQSALKLDPRDGDSKFNLELVQRKIEELKQQMQQQQQQQSKQGKDPKDQDKNDPSKQDQKKEKAPGNEKESESNKKQLPQESQKPEGDLKSEAEKKSEAKSDEKKEANQSGKDGQESQKKPGSADAANQTDAGKNETFKMTPAQAVKLLERQKEQERNLIFMPKGSETNRARVVRTRDW